MQGKEVGGDNDQKPDAAGLKTNWIMKYRSEHIITKHFAVIDLTGGVLFFKFRLVLPVADLFSCVQVPGATGHHDD